MIRYDEPMGQIGTDTIARLGAPLGEMHPESTWIGRLPRSADHAFVEFGQKVTSMSELTGSTDAQALGGLVTELTREMKALADAQAAPRLHWAIPTFGATLVVAIGTALISWGSLNTKVELQNSALRERVVQLEANTKAVEEIAALRAQIVTLTGTVERLENRFNTMMDSKRIAAAAGGSGTAAR